MKTTVFVADLHLDVKQPEVFALWQKLLRECTAACVQGKTQTCSLAQNPAQVPAQASVQTPIQDIEVIYILGDFFALWVGDDDLSPFNLEVIASIKSIVQAGIKVYLMPGNRDFMLGEKFVRISGCNLLMDPTIINLYGVPTLLTHGDILCTKDKTMSVFRFITRGKWCRELFLALPLKWRQKIGALVRDISSRKRRGEEVAKKNLAVDETMVQSLLRRYGAQQMVHGHIHAAGIFPAGGDISAAGSIGAANQYARRIVVNEWLKTKGSVLFYYADGNYELKSY